MSQNLKAFDAVRQINAGKRAPVVENRQAQIGLDTMKHIAESSKQRLEESKKDAPSLAKHRFAIIP